MRRLAFLVRRSTTCPDCGAAQARTARWCGTCGASLAPAAPPPEEVVDVDVASAGAQTALGEGRRPGQLVAAVGLAIAVVVALVVAPRGPVGPGESLDGRLDVHTGVSSTAPPGRDLAVVWEREVTAPMGFGGGWGRSFGLRRLGGDRVQVGDAVVDTVTGAVVGVPSPDVVVVDSTLVVLDPAGGAVLARHPLDLDLPDGAAAWRLNEETYAIEGSAGPTGLPRTTIVGRDGEVRGDVDGTISRWGTRTVDSPYAIAELHRSTATVIEDGVFGLPPQQELLVVDTRDAGAVRRIEWSPETVAVSADLVGELLMIARVESSVRALGRGYVWQVEVVDLGASSAVTVLRRELLSGESPMLLGRRPDGGVLIAEREGGQLRVDAHEGPRTEAVLRAENQGGSLTGGDIHGDRSMPRAIAMHDGTLAWLGSGELHVEAQEGSWSVPAADAVAMELTDGVVALSVTLGDAGEEIRHRLYRLEDGAHIATIEPDERWSSAAAVAASDEVLFVTRDGNVFEPRTLTQLLVQRTSDGQPLDLTEAVAQLYATPPDATVFEELPHGVELIGMVPTAAGVQPLMVHRGPEDVLSVVGPDGVLQPLPLGEQREQLEVEEGDELVGLSGWSHRRVIGGADGRTVAIVEGEDGDGATVRTVVLDGVRVEYELQDVYSFGHTRTSLVGLQVAPATDRWELVVHELGDGARRWLQHVSPGWVAFDDRTLVRAGIVQVQALDMADGTVRWTHDADVALDRGPVILEEHVVVATAAGSLLALDRETGEVAWTTELGGVASSPVIGAGDHVLVGLRNGTVVEFDHRGRELQRIVVTDRPVSGVMVVGSDVIALTDSQVLALRPGADGIVARDEVDLP